MYKVLISDAMSNVADQIFEEKNISVDVITDLSEAELINIIPEYDGLLVRSSTAVTKDILAAAIKLKAIARAGSGVDNIDCTTARENGVVVMNTPGGNNNATAEHAFALIMAALRQIPYADKTTHNGEWQKKAIKGVELSKKTLGIVGFGNIGARLSHLVSGFDVNVLVCSKSLESRQAEFPHVTNVSFDELLSQSDIISFHGKAASDGKPLLRKEHFGKMKSSAIIINTARGNLVDESDLNDALNEGLIARVAIDVFSTEPAKENVLFNNPKAILTPHIGASTAEASIVVAEMAANQVANLLLEGTELHVVN